MSNLEIKGKGHVHNYKHKLNWLTSLSAIVAEIFIALDLKATILSCSKESQSLAALDVNSHL